MEEITIPLNQRINFGPRWFTTTQIIVSVIFIAQGFAYTGTSLWFARFAIAYGVALLIAMIVLPRFAREYSVKIDEQGIRGRTGYFETIDLRWEDLAQAEIKMFALILTTKGGGKIHIDFGNLTYDQHKVVKPYLIDTLGSRDLLKKSA